MVVLNACVTETKEHACASKTSTSLAKSISDAGQPVDLVDDDDIDLARLDVGQQALQGRALQGAAGEAAIVVAVGQQPPALVLLAGDVGLAGLALGIERVEVLLQPLLGGLAGVDGAADGARRSCRHPPSATEEPGPDQRVPVIARATADNER